MNVVRWLMWSPRRPAIILAVVVVAALVWGSAGLILSHRRDAPSPSAAAATQDLAGGCRQAVDSWITAWTDKTRDRASWNAAVEETTTVMGGQWATTTNRADIPSTGSVIDLNATRDGCVTVVQFGPQTWTVTAVQLKSGRWAVDSWDDGL